MNNCTLCRGSGLRLNKNTEEPEPCFNCDGSGTITLGREYDDWAASLYSVDLDQSEEDA